MWSIEIGQLSLSSQKLRYHSLSGHQQRLTPDRRPQPRRHRPPARAHARARRAIAGHRPGAARRSRPHQLRALQARPRARRRGPPVPDVPRPDGSALRSGFGRTGKMFACEHWDVVPDILTMAKGLTSSYIPLGAMGVRDSIAQHFRTNVFWGGTRRVGKR